MRIRSLLALASVLAGAMIIGTTVPSMALWTVSSSPLTSSASAGTLGATLSGIAGLAQSYTPSSAVRTSAVTFGNTGSLPTTYSGSVALGSGSSSTMASKVIVKAWPQSSAVCNDTVALPSNTVSGTWAAFPALTGSLGPNATTVWCVRTTLPAADQTALAGASVAPTYTLALAAGSWTANATEATTQTVLDATAPTVPTGLAASGTTSTSTTLTWNASTDNVGVTGYKVYVSTDGGVTYALLTTQTARSYTVAGGMPLKTYSFAVSAIDAAGNESAKSTALNVKTLAPSSTAWYQIVNDNSGRCVDADGGNNTVPGAKLIQWDCHGGTNQQFQFQSSGLIVPRSLTSVGWAVNGTASGALLTVENTAQSDVWVLTPLPLPSASYQIRLQGTMQCASIAGGSTANSAQFELRPCDANSRAQTFSLTER